MLKAIPNFDNYFADENGIIYSNFKSSRNPNKDYKIIKSGNNGRDYLQVSLRKDGKNYNRYIHRLVYSAFNGEIESNMNIDHINGNKFDNSLDNLRKCTNRENRQFQNKKINSSSGEHNIYFVKSKNSYRISFQIKGKIKHFGYFKDLSKAIIRRNEINKIIHENSELLESEEK